MMSTAAQYEGYLIPYIDHDDRSSDEEESRFPTAEQYEPNNLAAKHQHTWLVKDGFYLKNRVYSSLLDSETSLSFA